MPPSSESPDPAAFGLPRAPANSLEEGLQLTEYLKSSLQIVRRTFLQVGKLLEWVQDKKLFAAMGHADLESYAHERLKLGRTSLYKYMHVYHWVKDHHPEWIDAAPGVVIPDLNDVEDMIRIEEELKKPDLEPDQKGVLEDLHKKALEGRLRKKDLPAFRQASDTSPDPWNKYLAQLRATRRDFARLKDVPAEGLAQLDSAITTFEKAKPRPAGK